MSSNHTQVVYVNTTETIIVMSNTSETSNLPIPNPPPNPVLPDFQPQIDEIVKDLSGWKKKIHFLTFLTPTLFLSELRNEMEHMKKRVDTTESDITDVKKSNMNLDPSLISVTISEKLEEFAADRLAKRKKQKKSFFFLS